MNRKLYSAANEPTRRKGTQQLAGGVPLEFTPDYHRSYVFIGTQGRMESFEPLHRRGDYQREYRREVLFRDRRPTRTLRFQHGVEGGHGGADPRMVIDWLRSLQRGTPDPVNPIAGRQSVAVGCLAAQSLREDNARKTLPPLP